MTSELLAIAEAPAAHIIPRHPGTVIGDGYVVSQMGPNHGVVQAIRLDDDRIAAARAEVLAVAHAQGWTGLSWWTSELTRPLALGELLGLDRDEELTGLALTEQPRGSGGFDVRRVETLEEFATAQNIDGAEYGLPPRPAEEHAASWERLRDTFLLWLAFDGDRAVGMARAAAAEGALMLIGGATVEGDRGRGVYRSLVEARWRAAVERGTPALVVAANSQSAPILEQLGFESVGAIQTWADRL